MKPVEITPKHIEALVERNVVLIFTISGTFKAQFYGKVVGRLRTRFKQYIFVPRTPFVSFYFSVGDVESIEEIDGIFVVKIGTNPGPATEKKRSKKQTKKTKKVLSRKRTIRSKKTIFPTVAAEPESSVIDLSDVVKIIPSDASKAEIMAAFPEA